MTAKDDQRILNNGIKLAALYFLLLGAAWGLSPKYILTCLNVTDMGPLWVWHWVGIMIASYGLGLLLAQKAGIKKSWLLLLTGTITMALMILVTVTFMIRQEIPSLLGWTVIGSNLICLIPFSIFLYGLALEPPPRAQPSRVSDDLALDTFKTASGQSLATLSRDAPVLLVLLRQLGSPFCRETLADLTARRSEIESAGAQLVLVHTTDEAEATPVFKEFGLEDVGRISDPEARLYRSLGLRSASAMDIYGPRLWWRTFQAVVLDGHGAGKAMGDAFQMPGAFLILNGSVVGGFRHEEIYDHPDYLSIVACASPAEDIHL